MGISCQQAVDFISKKEESKLTASQKIKLWKHMAICSLCRLFYNQNKLIISTLKSPQVQMKEHYLSQESKDVILKSLKKIQAEEGNED